jgi:SAM-dependent methyltransferase
MGMWPYQEAHPELAATFNQFMTRMTAGREEALLAAYDFAGITTLVDVGGGYGAVFAAVLRAYPHMRGILFDLPQALDGASEALAATSAAARCTLVAGDFFEAVPPGGDAYLLSGILHDWDDERAHVILMNCHRAMAPGGRVLVLDLVVPAARIPPAVAFLDLNMHVMGGGRERTAAELGTLFTEAGFELTRVVPFGPTRAVVEGVRR